MAVVLAYLFSVHAEHVVTTKQFVFSRRRCKTPCFIETVQFPEDEVPPPPVFWGRFEFVIGGFRSFGAMEES